MRTSANTYRIFPLLKNPGNSILLLLTWSKIVSGRPLKVLSDWARSEDGWNLYKQLARDFRIPQSVEQLALTMAALMSYRRLYPDSSDHSDQPIKASYLADLDALLNGRSLGNSGVVGERMIFSLVRVLCYFVDQFADLVTFLVTVLDRDPPLLHVFDGFSDQYLLRRINGQPHETAIGELSHSEMPELGTDDDPDWVTVTRMEALSLQDHSQKPYSETKMPVVETEYVPAVLFLLVCTDRCRGSVEQSQGYNSLKIGITHTIEISTTTRSTEEDTTPSYIVAVSSLGDKSHLSPPPGLRADQYTLIRLSKVKDENVLEKLDKKIGTVTEVPNIEELSDGSWEICILKSHRRTVQDTLGKTFPGSDVDLYYNPFEPAANDLKIWDYDTAKKLRQHWFFQRAIRVVKKGWPAAAACYAYLLEVMFWTSLGPATGAYISRPRAKQRRCCLSR
jgi:hypothetical protein